MFHQVSLRRLSRSEKDPSPIYLNPILPGFNPDPSIIYLPSPYNLFLLTTSSFEYFPGIPVYCSPDLIQWTLLSHAINESTIGRSEGGGLRVKTPEPGGGVWAVTIREHKGYVYVTSASWDRFRPQDQSSSNNLEDEGFTWPRGFYLRIKIDDLVDFSAESGSVPSPVSPSSPTLPPGDPARDAKWEGPVWFDQLGFDQDLFFDDDGTTYLSTTYRIPDRARDINGKKLDFAVHVSKIDLKTGKSLSAPVLIRESDTPRGVAEGSHIIKRGKYYYLFTAEGGTESNDHCEKVFRSEKGPFGPWEENPHAKDRKGALWKQDDGGEVQNTGHSDLVQDADGRWWAVCLGVRPLLHKTQDGTQQTNSVFGRETFLMPVTWTSDDNPWPVFNHDGGPVKTAMQAPPGIGDGKVYLYTPPTRWRDDFAVSKDGKLGIGWYRKNTPLLLNSTKEVSVNADRKGYLRLWGNAYTLASPACPTMVLRKQINQEGVWRTRLDFMPDSDKTEAGAVVYWNYFTSSSIGVRGKNGNRIVRARAADGVVKDVDLKTPDAEVTLFIECQEDKYRLGFEEVLTTNAKKGKEPVKTAIGGEPGIQWIGEVSTRVMTRDPPVGMSFTGMMLGLYAFGEMEKCLRPADFAFAEFM